MKFDLKYLVIVFLLISSIHLGLSQQTVWDEDLDQKTEWIALVDQYFGSEFEYIGTRDNDGPPQVLFLDRESISKKGIYYESTFYQMILTGKESAEDGGGVLIKTLCNCNALKVKITYFGTLDGRIGGEQNDGWLAGIGDGFVGRIVKTICNPRNQAFDYINLVKSNGVYHIPIKINSKVSRDFVFDSGAADLYISKDFEQELIERGALSAMEYSKQAIYEDANGNLTTCTVYTIKQIQIGSRLIKNVECAVSPQNGTSHLLGQSLLEKLGKYEIDYTKNQLILK